MLGFPDAYHAADHVDGRAASSGRRPSRAWTPADRVAAGAAAERDDEPDAARGREGWLTSSIGGETRRRPRRSRRRSPTRCAPCHHRRGRRLLSWPGWRRCGGSARRALACSPAPRTAARLLTRLEDAAVPPERFGAHLREPEGAGVPRPQGHLLRPLRRRLLPVSSDRLRPADEAGDRELPGVHDRRRGLQSSRTAGRCSASTATATRRAVAPGCTRRRSSPGSSGSRRSGTRRLMNPGRVVRPATMDENLWVQLGMPNYARRAEAGVRPRGSFHRATRRCSAWASARSTPVPSDAV
ncbi:hypothetical protein HBB16_06135 [Pseudonocardia sp. MCCB 268]|nr:hypothetical protein [Pseudonocardia cytotoxica]